MNSFFKVSFGESSLPKWLHHSLLKQWRKKETKRNKQIQWKSSRYCLKLIFYIQKYCIGRSQNSCAFRKHLSFWWGQQSIQLSLSLALINSGCLWKIKKKKKVTEWCHAKFEKSNFQRWRYKTLIDFSINLTSYLMNSSNFLIHNVMQE